MQSMVLALQISHFPSVSTHHRSAFALKPFRKAHHLQHHGVRSRALILLASEGRNDGDFFSDGSGGSFFEEVAKPPTPTPQPQPQPQEKVDEPDGSGGSFFEEVLKPPTPEPQEKVDEAPMTLEDLEELATPYDEHLPKINTVTLVGRAGNDPEPRYFDDGKVVLNLSLAVKRKYHALERKVREIRSGDEETDWFPLEFWGRDAEYVTNYVEKGARLGVTGSLVMDGWVDKATGEQRRKAKIIVRHIDILESRAEAELRKSSKGSYTGNSSGGYAGKSGGGYSGNSGGGKKYGAEDDESGPSPAGTGGFFS